MQEIFLGPNLTISEIVRSDYRTADVFKKHQINFCCSGQVSLEEACSTRNLDCDMLLMELESATRRILLPNSLRFDKWKLDFLVDYIINVHHAYLEQTLPSLEAALTAFMEGHKKKYPVLLEVHAAFLELSRILQVHAHHEENTIFPYIKQIVAAFRRNEPYGSLLVRTLRKPLSQDAREHMNIASRLLQLKSQTNEFTHPANACTNFQVIYHKLREFNDDLLQHMHLENNILYPQALKIEEELLRI